MALIRILKLVCGSMKSIGNHNFLAKYMVRIVSVIYAAGKEKVAEGNNILSSI